MKQFCLTTVMAKRLIAKAMAVHPMVKARLEKGNLVIVAGTTNGYVAEEVLGVLGQAEGFSRFGFRRGMVAAPSAKLPDVGFPGDVVIQDGKWDQGKTLYDVVDDLRPGDVLLKGANAFDPQGRAAVLIGDRKGGTVMAAISAVVGRRVQMLIPVGLEKRVLEDIHVLTERCNATGAQGTRLCPMPGRIFTELDAIQLLTGAEACLIAAGGIYGAEGASWLGVSGDDEQIQNAMALIQSIIQEPPCEV